MPWLHRMPGHPVVILLMTHHCNSQRTSYSLFAIMYLDFYKGIYIVYLILFFLGGGYIL